MSRFLHDARDENSRDEWYTPPGPFEALGIEFDLDPAAPPGGVPWIPAAEHLSKAHDGLTREWVGRVWLNPPYGRQTGKWLRRLASHGDGLALVFARTDTAWFQEASHTATAICFIAGRIRFVGADGCQARASAGAGSLLIAFGLPCALARVESGLGQTFPVPRQGRPTPQLGCPSANSSAARL